MAHQQRQRILTGLRANNDLTLGNYLGALLPMADMAKKHANEYDINLFVPDLHSFTTPINHSQLQDQIMQNLRTFVAAGLPIDHQNVFVYRQSYIAAHSELTWILDCFTGFGEMRRMTQFKEKAGIQDQKEVQAHIVNHVHDMRRKFGENYDSLAAIQSVDFLLQALILLENMSENDATVGLFNYPVLMAADILLYNATYVPVGDDQTQHLEFTRDIAERMNSRFGQLFTVPHAVPKQHAFFGKDQGLRIKDLFDPTKKMSKSDDTGKGVIFMNDTPEAAAKKIMAATTDSLANVTYNMQNQPGITNLLQILALLSGRDQASVNAEWQGKQQYGELKKAVATVVADFLRDFQSRLAKVEDAAILQNLQRSETTMQEVANATLLRAQKAVGLRA